jgi:RNase adaptor protein for sRNA GlmZ degradation
VSVEITSFGYLHGAPPEGAHITIDLRHHFRDPHVHPDLRNLTAQDTEVYYAVLNTSGIRDLIDAIVSAVKAFTTGPTPGVLRVAIGCAGGRHRAAVVAHAVTYHLNEATGSDDFASLVHRDLDRPVVDR